MPSPHVVPSPAGATPSQSAEDLVRISEAISLAQMANSVLLAAVFAPLCLTAYDATLAPAFSYARRAEGSPAEIACEMLKIAVMLPYELASSAYDMCAASDAVLDVAGEVEATSAQRAAEAERGSSRDERFQRWSRSLSV